ncbi:MAG: DNA topoisomerase IB [Actinomycetota bacterium]|nr:DNA topoisomerase IB [Actinomycetota bacterium]
MAFDSVDLIDEGPRSAAEAGLRYVNDTEPGIHRTRCGRGFRYTRASGTAPVGAGTKSRIESLAIPPAWTDVWICSDELGHLQATGRDARGRKQYRYHPRWRTVRDEAKFEQLAAFGASLGQVRAVVNEDLGRSGLPPRKVIALVIALLDETLIRVGNEEYRRENGTFGLTTLEEDQVSFGSGEMTFCFIGKGGSEFDVDVRDRRLTRAVRACHELGGRELFTYRGTDGLPVRVDSSDCNEYLADIVGPQTTVKYFRTWGGSVAALEHLVEAEGPLGESDVVAAVDAAAQRLNNTRAVCRRAYVHPRLTDDLDEERLRAAWSSARRTEHLSRGERALVRLLEDGDGGDDSR